MSPRGRPKREALSASRDGIPAKGPALRLTLQGLEEFTGLPGRATLRRWVLLALRRDARITLRFVGRREGRRLNRDFRGRDYATNVLTFDYGTRPEVTADIVLCPPVLAQEARGQRKPLRDHLAHLVVHGVLHAQGHDHQSPATARAMEARERRLLLKLGIPDPYRIAGAH